MKLKAHWIQKNETTEENSGKQKIANITSQHIIKIRSIVFSKKWCTGQCRERGEKEDPGNDNRAYK